MAKYDLTLREEEIKLKVAKDWFANYDTTQIIDNIDFAVAIQPQGNELFKQTEYLLWAEAKKGNKQNIYDSVIQLIFTIGKGRINEKHMPPKYIGAFDAEKIAFIPYNAIMEVFSQTDFNWNVPPSDHSTKEFQFLKTLVRNALEQSSLEEGNEAYRFDFVENRKELKNYISKNFKTDRVHNRGMRITRNSFVSVYNQWRKEVMPTISMPWDVAKKHNILDADFFLADLMLGKDNEPIMDKLRVLLLKTNKYQLKKEINELGLFNNNEVGFRDNMVAYRTFWARYERPPKKEYWDMIVERRDLLVPQDIREVKGSYFTPPQWVAKSQEYLEQVLGENWQDDYYIWDCCAGTGNLLANLTNKYNIWASTLDLGDVQVIHERIKHMEQTNPNGSNLLDSHVFQFDFLNDEFSKLPQGLQEIINDEEKRKKLVIYINPPYAETAQKDIHEKDRVNKRGVSFTAIQKKYAEKIGIATKELFAQFLIRVKHEISSCTLAQFSKLKIVQGPNFSKFRDFFRANFKGGFVVPAATFDNVSGSFPIGFMIWDLNTNDRIKEIKLDIINKEGENYGHKSFFAYDENVFITDWFRPYHTRVDGKENVGAIGLYGSDFQHNNFIYLTSPSEHTNRWTYITASNLIPSCIYLSVRHCIPATWLNDRDQFLYPRKAWKEDKEFQFDCLAFTLFHGQNRITSTEGINHWIPFTEAELKAPDTFQSHFMSDFIAGKIKPETQATLFEAEQSLIPTEPIQFSPEAKAVMDAGRELWYYYMHHKDGEMYGAQSINVNASYYDIRRYFQGETNGKMNPDSKDETYMRLWGNIKDALKVLAKKIEPKVYLYGFLLDETTLPEDEHEEIMENPTKEPVKKARKTLPKPKAQTIVHYHIDHVDTLNLGDNVENKFS